MACARYPPKDFQGTLLRRASSPTRTDHKVAVRNGNAAVHERRPRPQLSLWGAYRRVITAGKTRMLVRVHATGMAVQKHVAGPAAIRRSRHGRNRMSSESSHCRSPRAIPNKLRLIEQSCALYSVSETMRLSSSLGSENLPPARDSRTLRGGRLPHRSHRNGARSWCPSANGAGSTRGIGRVAHCPGRGVP